MIPPPLYKDNYQGRSQEINNNTLPNVIPKVAQSLGLKNDQIIDVFENMGGKRLDKWE